MTPSAWSSSAASVVGARHRRLGQGNQDGLALLCEGDLAIAVVTDGCGSTPNSQVGSQLGAQLWLGALARYCHEADAVSRAKADVLAQLDLLVGSMGAPRVDSIRSHFLFTTVGVVARGAAVEVFAIGDGAACIDDVPIDLGPFQGDQPPYLAYELLGLEQPVSTLWSGPAHSVVLATDGATPTLDLAGLVRREDIFARQDALRRYLVALSSERVAIDWDLEVVDRSAAPLVDDTTVVALRRTP